GGAAFTLDFDDGINALRSNLAPSFRVQEDIAERFGASLSYMMAIAEGPSVDEAVRRAQLVQERLKPFLADGTVASEDSILDYLPLPDRQRAVIDGLRAHSDGAFDLVRIRRE